VYFGKKTESKPIPRTSLTLQKIEAVMNEFEMTPLAPQLKACRDVASSGGFVDVALLGRFKAGKSSFINALIGKPVMPGDVLPATAVVTQIGYGRRDRAVVRFNDGTSSEIALEDLAEFVTEKKNPGNSRQVAFVDIETDALSAWRGLRFVDTPGLGSAILHNTKTALEWLPEVGVALVAVAVDPPLSEDDLKLLQELTKHTPEIAILLTKADLVDPEQLKEVTAYIGNRIDTHIGRDLRVFPFSNRPGYENLLSDLKNRLFRPIVEKCDDTFDEILHHKVAALQAGCRDYLQLALRSAEAGEQARGDLLGLLLTERQDFQQMKNEIRLVTDDLIARVRSTAHEHFQRSREIVETRLREDLQGRIGKWEGNLEELSEKYRKWLELIILREMKAILDTGREVGDKYLTDAQSIYNRVVRAFQDRVAGAIHRALDMKFNGATFQSEIKKPASPDIRIGKVFDTPFEAIWFLVPMKYFRKYIDRHFFKLIPWEAEKNLHRLSAQWEKSIMEAIERMAQDALDFIRKEILTVEKMAKGTEGRAESIRSVLAELNPST
jgi:GTP-binding protein EngB required for normal cell division